MNRDKLYILVRLIMINNKRLIAWKKQILAFAALSAMATAVLTEAILWAALSSTWVDVKYRMLKGIIASELKNRHYLNFTNPPEPLNQQVKIM